MDRMLLLQDASLEICSPGTQGHCEHAPIFQAFQPHSPLNFWSRGENTTLFTLLRISFSRGRGKEKQTKGRGKRKGHFLINTCWVKFLLHRLSERVVWWLSHHHPGCACSQHQHAELSEKQVPLIPVPNFPTIYNEVPMRLKPGNAWVLGTSSLMASWLRSQPVPDGQLRTPGYLLPHSQASVGICKYTKHHVSKGW